MNSNMPAPVFQAVPNWFLALSTVLLIVIMIMFVVLTIVMFQLWKAVQRVEPKIEKLMDHVNDELVPQVKGLVTRVDAIGSNIQGLTGSASNTMGMVRAKTETVSSALEHFASTGIQKVEKLAPIFGYLAVGVRVYQMFLTMKSARDSVPPKAKPKTLPKK